MIRRTPTLPRAAAGILGRRASSRSRSAVLAGIGLLVAVLSACGGGSPSDILLPSEVSVALSPLEADVPATVSLGLAAASGDEIGIEVRALELQGVTGVAFELDFDPALLEFTGFGPGTFFAGPAAIEARVVDRSPGKLVGVAAALDQSAGRTGSGTLLTLQFRLRQLRDVESTIVFAIPQSLVYGPAGVTGRHTFTSARLVTRIRAPE